MNSAILRTSRNFSIDQQPHLRDHRLYGMVVISGASMVTSIAELVNNHLENGASLVLRDIFFCRPLIIDKNGVDVNVDIERDRPHGRLIFSHSGQTYATCSGVEENNGDGGDDTENNSKFYSSKVVERMVSAADFYTFMHRHGYDYGSAFRGVADSRLTVEKPNKNNEKTICYGLCRMNGDGLDVIIDSTFQAMVHAILFEGQEDGDFMIVPFFIEKSCIRPLKVERLTDCEIYANFRVCVEKRTGDCFVKCNGEEIFSAEGVLFRPLRGLPSVDADLTVHSFEPKSAAHAISYDVRYGIRAMSCRLPGDVNSPADFWRLLSAGSVTDRRISPDRIPTRNNLLKNGHVEGANFIGQNVQDFDAAFFGISRAESEAMDPQQRLLLECVYECMENAGLKSLAGPTGFFVGLMGTEYLDIAEAAGRRDMLSMLGSSASIVAGRLNYYFDGFGPAFCVDTACSSSLACIDLAIQTMSAGRCERAIVAGVNLILTEKGLHQRANGKMLSWDGACRTFDAHAGGYGRADGCAAILIEQVQDGQKYEAIIESVNVNHDGRSTALTAPNPVAQTKLISRCLEKVQNKKLLFWECHGTGTQLGDPIEYAALKSALSSKISTSSQPIFVSSAKASIGHCEAASGLVGLLKTVLQLQNSYIPRLPRFCVLNEQIRRYDNSNTKLSLKIPICGVELDNEKSADDTVRVGGVSSFGVSGTNACILISVPKRKNSNTVSSGQTSIAILPISAKSAVSLEANLMRCMEVLKAQNGRLNACRIMKYCRAYALNRPQYRHQLSISFRIESDGFCLSEIIRKTAEKAPNLKFVADIWPSFEFDLFCRIPAYRTHFANALALAGMPLMKALNANQNGLLLVADVLAKYNMLLDWGVVIKERIVELNNVQLSIALLELLERPNPFILEKCVIIANELRSRRHLEMRSNIKNENWNSSDAIEFRLDSVDAIQRSISFAYANGHSLNWEKIYPPNGITDDVLLPNYVFNRKPYWICKQLRVITHGLIGNLVNENEDYVIFENMITAKRLPFLHRVRRSDERLFPLGAILEMIIAAAYSITNGKSGDGVRITNIALPKPAANWLAGDFWLSTTVNIRFSTLEMLIGDKKVPLGNANFCSVKNLCKEKWQVPDIEQQIDEREFKTQIFKNSNIDYSEFDRVDVFLDSGCNIVKIATDSNPITDGEFVINPVLLETFAQILLNYGVIKDYDVIVRRIKMIEIFKRIDRFCYIDIDDNVIESFDSNRDLAMRFVLDLSVTKAESNILSLPITRSQLNHIQDIHRSANQMESLNKKEITRRIMNALEDSLALESPLNQASFDVGFVDLGLDSLSLVGFLNKINDEYFPGVGLSSTELFSNPTISSLTAFIDEKRNSDGASTADITVVNQPTTGKPVTIPKADDFRVESVLNKSFECEKYSHDECAIHAYKLLPQEGKQLINAVNVIITVNEAHTVRLNINDKFINDWTIAEPKDFNSTFRLAVETIIDKCNGHRFGNIQLRFNDTSMPISCAAKLLLSLGKSLVNCSGLPFLKFHTVCDSEVNPLNGMAAGFFKSFVAEKPERFGFTFPYRLERMKSLEVSLPHPAPCGSWLITGGTSGIGFEMAEYLAMNYNVITIGIVGRRPIEDESLVKRLLKIRRYCDVQLLNVDISDYDQLKSTLKAFLPHMSDQFSLVGVIHSAGFTRDCRIELMSENAFDEVLRPKCVGLENLERCLEEFHLSPTFFIVNSSISSTLGNSSQCNYSAANSWADAFVRRRRRRGLSGTSIQWGNWLETGMAARLGVNALLEAVGFQGLRPAEAMTYFRYVLESNPEAVVVAKIDWKTLLKKRPELRNICENHSTNFADCNAFEVTSSEICKNSHEPLNQCKPDSSRPTLIQRFKNSSSPSDANVRNDQRIYGSATPLNNISKRSKIDSKLETVETVKSVIKRLLATFIGEENYCLVANADKVGLIELGLDSLKLSILATELQSEFFTDFTISVIDLFQNPTVDKLSNHIWTKIRSFHAESSNPLDSKISDTIAISISYEDLQVIAQHRIGSEIVVPAAFQIRQFECLANTKTLKNIFFKNPIYTKSLSSLTLKVNRSDKAETQLTLFSKFSDDVIFSSACSSPELRISEAAADDFLQKVRLYSRSRSDFGCLLSSCEFYKGMRTHGIDYGKRFQLLDNIVIYGDFVTAQIRDDHESRLNKEEFSWYIYDAALQALSAVLFDPKDASYYVPVQIDTFWQILDNFRNSSASFMVYGQIFQRQEHFLHGTVVLVNCDKVVMFVEGVTAIRLRNKLNSESTLKLMPEKLNWNANNLVEMNLLIHDSVSRSDVQESKPNISGKSPCDSKNGTSNHSSSDYECKIIVIGWSGGYIERTAIDYDAEFFNINAKEAPFVDPQQRLLLEAVVEAMECAEMTSLPAETGVFIGGSSSDFAQRAFAELDAVGYMATGTNNSVLSGRVAHFLGAAAGAETVDAACSSFTVALARACDALRAQRCEFAVVGAVNVLLNAKTSEVLHKLGVLSAEDRCASFDVDADGYRRSGAAGAIILRRLDLSKAQNFTRPVITVAGWATGHAGADAVSMTVSSTVAQQRIITEALAQASLIKVDLIECHGSATPLGDPIEALSILQTFPEANQLLLSAAKSKYGHCEAAAGLISFLEMLKTIQSGRLKSFHHFKCMNSRIRAMTGAEKFLCPIIGIEAEIKSVLINNFAFNGTNAATVLVLENLNDYSNKTRTHPSNNNDSVGSTMRRLVPSTVLLLSAKSAKSLQESQRRVNEYFRRNEYQQRRAVFELCEVFMHGRYHYRPYRSAYLIDYTRTDGVALRKIGGPSDRLSGTRVTVTLSTADSAEDAISIIVDELKRNCAGFRNFSADRNSVKTNIDQSKSHSTSYIFNLAIAEFLITGISPHQSINFQFQNDEEQRYFAKFGSCRIRDEMNNKLSFSEQFFMEFSTIFNLRNGNRPSSTINEIFGRLFIAGVPLEMENFQPKTSFGPHYDLKIPGYAFNRRRFWPFKDANIELGTDGPLVFNNMETAIEASRNRFEKDKDVATFEIQCYQRIYEPIDFDTADSTIPVIFETIDYRNDEANDDNVLEQIRKGNSGNVLIIWSESKNDKMLIQNFLRFGRFFGSLIRKKLVKLIVLAESDSPAIELSAFLRSAAAELPNLAYRIIFGHADRDSIASHFGSLKSTTDSSNCFQLADKKMFIERLVPVSERKYDQSQDYDQKTKGLGKVLITGGSGGLARELVRRLDAQMIITVSRRKPQQSYGARVRHYTADCSDMASMREVFRQEPNISVIFHCAGAVSNRRVSQLTSKDFHHVFIPKIKSTRNLLLLCQEFGVGRFCAVSSAAAALGSIGQANYAAANAMMEKICNASTVETSTILLGPLRDAGMLADELLGAIRRQILDAGWRFLRSADVADAILKISKHGDAQNLLLFAADWRAICIQQPHLTQLLLHCNSKFEEKTKALNQHEFVNKTVSFLQYQPVGVKNYSAHMRHKTLRYRRTPKIRLRRVTAIHSINSIKTESHEANMLKAKPIDLFLIGSELLEIIRRVSGLSDPQRDVGLMAMGIDSLMVEEIRAEAVQRFGVLITIAEIYTFVTVDELAAKIGEKLALSPENKETSTQSIPLNQKMVRFAPFRFSDSKVNAKQIHPEKHSAKNVSSSLQSNEDNQFEIQKDENQKKTTNDFKFVTSVESNNTYRAKEDMIKTSKDLQRNSTECNQECGNEIGNSNEMIKDVEFYEDDIAIIAMSGAFSGSRSIDEFWKNLLAGQESMTQADCSTNEDTDSNDESNENNLTKNAIRKFVPVSGLVPDAELFDSAPFGLSETDAQMLDPQVRYALIHAHKALEQSGYFQQRSDLRIGCFVGAEPSGFVHSGTADKVSGRGSLTEMFARNQKDFCAAWISYALNLHGPSAAVYAACATALATIRKAADTLTQSAADLCLAGAVHLVPADDVGHDFQPGMILASRGECRPFGACQGGGILRGSGCAFVVLKLARDAWRDDDRILGILKSCSLTNDGSEKSNFMAPGLRGQTAAIRDALAKAAEKGVTSNDVSYLECHATGTFVGDAIEMQAVTDAFELQRNKRKPLLVGSVKANIGHAFAAAGMASLAKCLKILETGIVPPQLGKHPDQNSTADDVIAVAYSRHDNIFSSSNRPPCVAMNCFGIGGTNASAVIVGPPQSRSKGSWNTSKRQSAPLIDGSTVILPISAATLGACLNSCRAVAAYLRQLADKNSKDTDHIKELKSVARTLQFRRGRFRWRVAVVAQNLSDAADRLEGVDKTAVRRVADTALGVENLAAYFAPQGVQYPEMLRAELRDSTWLRGKLNFIAESYDAIESESGALARILASDAVNDARYTQCALFAICRAASAFVAEALNDNSANICFGHSVGEYAALAEAEAITNEEAMRLLRIRGDLISETKAAKMLVVQDLNDNDPLLIDFAPNVEESARLSDHWRVLVGEPPAIDALRTALKAAGRECRPLKTAHGFHSSFLDPILPRFAEAARRVKFAAPHRAVLSNVDGAILTADRLDADYLCAHLRQPVRLDMTIDAALAYRPLIRAILEFGPPGMLDNLIQQRLTELQGNEQNAPTVRDVTVITTMQSRWTALRRGDSETPLFASLAQLWEIGFSIDFKRVCGNEDWDYAVPGYQFDLRVMPRPFRIRQEAVRDKELKIYRQTFKFEADLESIELCESSDWSRTLFVTNCIAIASQIGKLSNGTYSNESVTTVTTIQPPTTVLWMNKSEQRFLKTEENKFILSVANESDFIRLREKINWNKFNSLIYYFETQHDEINDETKIRATLNVSFLAMRQLTRHILTRFVEGTSVYCITAPNAGPCALTIFGALSAVRHEVPGVQNTIMIDGVPSGYVGKVIAYFTSLNPNGRSETIDFEWFQLRNGTLLRMFYERNQYLSSTISHRAKIERYDSRHHDKEIKSNIKTDTSPTSKDFALILGGTGHIGMNFARVLSHLNPNLRLIIASRRATTKTTRFADKFAGAQLVDVDLADREQVNRLIESLQFGRCRFVIQCAGLAPSDKITNEDAEKMFAAKIYGTINVLAAFDKFSIIIDALILNSSLTAINGLPGAADYSAANLFLDGLTKSEGNFGRVLSVQWPAWRDSKMFSTSRLSADTMVQKAAISAKQARKIILLLIENEDARGIFAISGQNPVKMRRYFMHSIIRNPTDSFNKIDDKTNAVIQTEVNFSPTDLKEKLRTLWRASLRHAATVIEDDDDFFALGGDSLSAVQLAWRVERALGDRVRVPPDWLMEQPRFADFWSKITETISNTAAVHTVNDSMQSNLRAGVARQWIENRKLIPLSLPQEQMFLLWRLERERTLQAGLYNIVFRVDIDGQLDVSAMEWALRRLCAIQAILRTRFPTSDHETEETASQEVLSLTESFHAFDWLNEQDCDKTKLEECSYDFDLGVSAPLRLRTLIMIDGRRSILVNHHHILTDGWSMTVFARQLAELYQMSMKASKNLVTYADYAIWNRLKFESCNNKLVELFARLTQFPAAGTVIETLNCPKNDTPNSYDDVELYLSADETRRLDALCAGAKTTRHVVLLAAFLRAADIWRADAAVSSPPLIIGCAVAGRPAVELDSLIGYFLNNVVLAVETGGETPLWSTDARLVVAHVRRAVDAALEYADVPFHRAVATMRRSRDGEHPVFQIFFNYRHNLDFPHADLGVNIRATISQVSKNRVFPLSCTIDEIEKRIRLTLDYTTLWLDARLAQSFIDEIVAQLRDICADADDKTVAWQRCADFGTSKPVPGVGLATALRSQALRTPRAPAICRMYENRATVTLSYDQLWARVGAQSRWLRHRYFCEFGGQIRCNEIIALIFADNNAVVPWMLAVLNCGAAYCVIDANFPPARIATLLKAIGDGLALSDVELSFVIDLAPKWRIVNVKAENNVAMLKRKYQRNGVDMTVKVEQFDNETGSKDDSTCSKTLIALQSSKHCKLQYSEQSCDFANANRSAPQFKSNEHSIQRLKSNYLPDSKAVDVNSPNAKSSEDRLAYVCFTSGTTGMPKGVCVTQRNVLAFIASATRRLAVDLYSRIAHSVNCAFDVSVFNIFSAFLNGACLMQLDSITSFVEVIPDVIRLQALTEKATITINRPFTHLFLNSAIFNALNDTELRRIASVSTARLIVGGETPSSRALRICVTQPDAHVLQIYGPTETTVWSTVHRVTSDCYDGAVIGTIQPNEFFILVHPSNVNARLSRHSLAIGELCIGGAGVAYGYLNSQIDGSSPFNNLPGVGRVYRTGDLVRRVNKDVYRFLGRNDTRLKIGGVRVDPTEIGDACADVWRQICSDSSPIRVFVCGEPLDSGETELVVYINVEEKATNLCNQQTTLDSLKTALTERLPRNVIPTAFILVDRIPIGQIGKVDRIALRAIYDRWRRDKSGTNVFESVKANKNDKNENVLDCLSAIWTEVLDTSERKLESNENFFALGGHSLLLFALKRRIGEEFRSQSLEVEIAELFRHPTLGAQSRLIADRLAASAPSDSDPDTISPSISLLRDASNEKSALNVYCIHAIGGTLYPYYSVLSVLPANWRVYGVHFDDRVNVESLSELARLYAHEIVAHQPRSMRPFLLLGHSLGGILSREIAILVNAATRPLFIPFVVAIDSWALGTSALDLGVVRDYLKDQFRLMPNRDRLLDSAMRLTCWLRAHKFRRADVGVRLFKATKLGEHSLRRCIRRPRSFSDSAATRALPAASDNGWTAWTDRLEVFRCDGDHDSILRAEALAPHAAALARLGDELMAGDKFEGHDDTQICR